MGIRGQVREPATDAHIPYLWANSGDCREALQIDAGSIRAAPERHFAGLEDGA
ncbi:MAG: hypothetical protein QOF74_8297 [Caballeronia mineralivorans]|jgi:hypothetical protein|nr:hypothetical protein [Caballeronia mineralivorans]